jgi:YgiT-type zinc finger domain-containing protein
MSKCPKCGKEIEHLIKRHIDVWETYRDGRNFLIEEYLFWLCPFCGEVLFEGFPDSEVEATAWLEQS